MTGLENKECIEQDGEQRLHRIVWNFGLSLEDDLINITGKCILCKTVFLKTYQRTEGISLFDDFDKIYVDFQPDVEELN